MFNCYKVYRRGGPMAVLTSETACEVFIAARILMFANASTPETQADYTYEGAYIADIWC